MKKIITIFIALIFIFNCCSCSETSTNEETLQHEDTAPADFHEIRVAVLNGTTGFGIAPLYNDLNKGIDHNINAKIDFYSDASLVAPIIIGGSVDIAAVPTNLAATLYNKTQGAIEVLVVNTLGVLYLIENGNSINSIYDLEGKTVFLPGSGSNPEFVLKSLLKLAGLTNKVTLDYTYSTPDELTSALAAQKASIGVIPEPKVTAATNKNSSLRVALDFSKEWKSLTGSELVQGCIIVRKEFLREHPIAVQNFLSAYKESVELINSDYVKAASHIVSAGLAPNEELVKNALPRCNITYLDGDDMINGLKQFWDALYSQYPASVGGSIPDDGIFG